MPVVAGSLVPIPMDNESPQGHYLMPAGPPLGSGGCSNEATLSDDQKAMIEGERLDALIRREEKLLMR